MTAFGLYAAIGDPPRGERLQQCIDEVCAEAQLAEQVGFDAILVGEHHQHRDGFLPSPLIVSTAVAARTQKIRIGSGILLLPLYHPVHVAEDAATLDIISKGRLILSPRRRCAVLLRWLGIGSSKASPLRIRMAGVSY